MNYNVYCCSYVEKQGAHKHKDAGLRLFTSGHIKTLKFLDDHFSTDTIIQAEVHASMKTSSLYKVSATTSKATGEVISGNCECKSGCGGVCKHVCCCLYALAHITTHELKHVPPSKSCTDGSRQWYNPRDPKHVSQNISDLEFVKDTNERLSCAPERYAKKKRYSCLEEERRLITSARLRRIQHHCKQVGMDCLADAIQSNNFAPEPLTKNHTVNECLPPTWLELFRESGMYATYSLEQVEEIERITRGQSSSALWNKYRTGMITSSIAHRVFTWMKRVCTKARPHNAGSLLQAVLTKRNIQTAAMKRGLDMEPNAKQAYLQKHNNKHKDLRILDCGLYVLPGCPFIGSSPDGLIECFCCERRLIEVKCPLCVGRFTKQHLQDTALKKSSSIYTQVQVQMGTTNINSCVVYIYHSNEAPVQVNVPFDKAHYLKVVELLTEFFRDYVTSCLDN